MSPAPKPVQDEVLLLKRTPYGESSLVVHLLSASHGRVEVIAKGAHRPKSRFSGVLDWFDTLRLDWTPPREAPSSRTELARISSLGTLRTGDVETRRRWITSSLDAYRAAHTAIELMELATRAGYADLDLFRLLTAALDEFNGVGRAERSSRESVADGDSVHEPETSTLELPFRLARYELRLLQALGLEPALAVCAACGQAAPAVSGIRGQGPPARVDQVPATGAEPSPTAEPRAPFAPQAGGRLCPRHAAEAHAAGLRVGTLPVHILDGAHALVHGQGHAASDQGGSRPHAASAAAEHEFGERILDFAGRFLDHQLETRPKSHAEFLGAPDRNRRARPSSTAAEASPPPP